MLKRFLLLLFVFSFSSSSTPLLYTFEGNLLGSSVIYNIAMDFEANGIENGSILYDYVDPFVLDDYGSAQLQMTSKTYYDNLIVFTTAYCNHYEGWFYSETLFDNYISFSGSIAEISRTLEFKNYQPAFKIGDIFKINESYNSASINGNVTLASIKSFNEPPASVPEPTMLSLLSVGLLGIGLSRKK